MTVITVTMNVPMRKLSLLFALLLTTVLAGFAQSNIQMQVGQQFRLGDGIIRIAEPGQIADTINVWGDVGQTGRYLVPRGTNLTDLISYARGPVRTTTGETIFDRSKFRVEVMVSRINGQNQDESFDFIYSYREPLPQEMRFFSINNGDLVYIQMRRKPTVRDYIAVIAPTVSLALSAILLYDRATNR